MTTKKNEATTVAGQVPAADLAAALNAVLPMADTDETLPVLTCVKFETRDGQLVLVTTNRYLLGTYRLDWEGGEVDALLPGRAARELLAFAKRVDKRLPITLTFGVRELEAADYERKATFPLDLDREFVKWAAIMPEHTPDRIAFGLNPAFLARFVPASGATPSKPGGAEPMRLSLGSPVKPIRVEIGDRFVGVAMPVRLPDVVATEEVKQPAEPAPVAEPAPEPAPATDAEPVVEEAPAAEADEPCPSCRGFGRVRGAGAKAGSPYRTANGAATATTAVDCPACAGSALAARPA